MVALGQRVASDRTTGGGGADFDPRRRFVRKLRERDGGFVEFEFAIGSPSLSVELVLPAAAFAEFCLTNKVERLDETPPDDRRELMLVPGGKS